jgi:AraC-like DNA-binding protein
MTELRCWSELMCLGPTPAGAAGVQEDKRELHLDKARVWAMEFGPLVFRRTEDLIRTADPETYNVFLLTRGRVDRRWGAHEVSYRPYDLLVMDSSRPVELRAHSAQGVISCAGIEIPRSLLPSRRADRLLGPAIPGQRGIGALLAGFLSQVTADPATYRPADRARLGLVATDLVSALFAHVLEEDHRPDAHRPTLLVRAKAFIRQHLHDPDLSPGVIAAAHHISVSYLHRLFQGGGVQVAAWIREQRLEHARRDLADPALRAVPVHEIAARWAFTHHAAFTRAFRTAYGVPPRDYRMRSLVT